MTDIEVTAEDSREMRTCDARAEIAKGLRMYKAFEKAADVLSVLDHVEASILEKNKIHDGLVNDIENLSDEKQSVQKYIDESKKKAEKDSISLVKDAEKNAEKILSDAKKQAEKIICESRIIVAEHDKRARALSENNALIEPILIDKKKELAEVTAAIAQHKEALKKFVG